MTDIDRLLRDSLSDEATAYVPTSVGEAEQVFTTRRRRRRLLQLTGGAVLAGVGVIAIVLFAGSDALQREALPVAAKPHVAGRVAVGDQPLAITGGDSGIWVANSGDSTVTIIDPTTGQTDTIDVPGADEIAVGAANAWVGGSDGRYARIDAVTHDVTLGTSEGLEGPSGIEDIAVGGTPEGAAWMVLSDGCVWEATIPARVPRDCIFEDGFSPTDVTTSALETYLLEQTTGQLFLLHSSKDGPGFEGPPPFDDDNLPSGPYGDLLNDGGGGLWVSGAGGRVTRISIDTGERTDLQLDGDYTDLAIGYNFRYIWALVGSEGQASAELYRLDASTGDVLDEPLSIDGKPSDITGFGHEAWVALRNNDEVLRVSDGEEDAAPPAAP